MTVIDIDMKCADIGIRSSDLFSAGEKVRKNFKQEDDLKEYPCFEEYLSGDELIAYIRWNGFDKRFPEKFTADGLNPNFREK